MNGISKNQIKHVKSLHQKKFREEHDMFIAEGIKVVREALNSGWEIVDLYASDSSKDFPDAIQISSTEMSRISAMKTPPGVLAVVKRKRFEFSHSNVSLVLDGIKDPGNLGTIIRSASWFGVDQLVLTEDCVDCYNPKVVQSTMGALFHTHIAYMNRTEIANSLEAKVSVYRADMNGENALSINYQRPLALVIGSESHGVSEELSAIADPVTIPRIGFGESLNAANACSILLAKICGG